MAPKKEKAADKSKSGEKKEGADARLDRIEAVVKDLRPSAFAESRGEPVKKEETPPEEK